MNTLDLNIGAPVSCQDGQCGKLRRVVVDPHTHRVTDLIVERGFLLTVDRVLPVDIVEEATRDEVHLSIPGKELKNYPEFKAINFREPAPEVQSGTIDRGDVRCWMGQYTATCQEPVIPMVRRHVHRGISSELAVIARGTAVLNEDGQVGHVDHLLVDPKTGEVSHLVIRRGLLPYYPILSMSEVTDVDENGVTVTLTEDEVKALPRYKRRDAKDIEAELHDRFAQIDAATPDLDLAKIETSASAGIVTLSGWVPDVQNKRRMEAVTRSVEGVVDVDNLLETQMSIIGRVRQALLTDKRTELSPIDVAGDAAGVITLEGSVDSPEVREAAQEIAAAQPGVVEVVSELAVEPDDQSELLNARYLAQTTTKHMIV